MMSSPLTGLDINFLNRGAIKSLNFSPASAAWIEHGGHCAGAVTSPGFASFLRSLCVALQRQPASSRSPGWLRLFIRLFIRLCDESRSGDLGAVFAMWAIVPAVGMQGMMFSL